MNYAECLELARGKMGNYCKACPGMQRKSLQESDAGSGSQRNRRYGDSEL